MATNTATAQAGLSSYISNYSQALSAFILGTSMLFLVGFLPMDSIHNAAHDTRHSFALPCH